MHGLHAVLGEKETTDTKQINSEVAKVSKVIKFEGNSYPHFFTWKRDALAATTEIGIPLAY